MPTFEELVAEALAEPFSGWDFSWLTARSTRGKLPWRYADEVAAQARTAASMLDQGTGGGEVLAALHPRPERTVATESWPPNVPVAARRLAPLGIPVVHCDGAPDNMSEEATSDRPERPGLLPFGDETFDLVINRHEAFRADEVHRILAPGGVFVTQQVDHHNYDGLFSLLGLEPPALPATWLPLASSQLTSAGLRVSTAQAGQSVTRFRDIGAIVYYLRVVGHGIPQYNLDAFLPRLREASDAADRWPLPVPQTRFLVVAAKSAP